MPIIVNLMQGLAIGGMERGTLQLARFMHDKGNDVRLVLFDLEHRPSEDQYDRGPLPAVFLARRPGVDWRFAIHLASLLSDWRPAILHARNHTALFYAALAKRIVRGIRPSLMVTFHSKPDGAKAQTKWAVRWAARQAVFSNAVSGELQQRLVSEGWADKVSLIRNGVDVNYFCPNGALFGLRKHFGIPEGVKLIGMVARFAPGKGHVDLIQAFRIVRDSRSDVALVLIGDGPLRTQIQEQTRDLESVVFQPNTKDIAAVLRELDVFVLCSEHEGAPRALLEAMACGIPVVATNVGGIPEILSIANSFSWLLVQPRSPRLLARSVLRVLDSQDIRNGLAERVRRRVIDAFSADRELAAYEEAYNTVLRGR
jgi:glycosyltransferase involved in cell wall biosynthesis